MQKWLSTVIISILPGCSILQSPNSWNASPAIIDKDHSQYSAIIESKEISTLVEAGNKLRLSIQREISHSRRNLELASAGNYGVALLGAATALSGLHSDVLLGVGFLGTMHVGLSQRLSPRHYIQILQNSGTAFHCLNSISQEFEDAQESADREKHRKNSTSSIVTFAQAGFSYETGKNEENYESSLKSLKAAYQRAIELTQAELDAEISHSNPTEIQNNILASAQKAARTAGKLEAMIPSDPEVANYLKVKEELDLKIISCLAHLH